MFAHVYVVSWRRVYVCLRVWVCYLTDYTFFAHLPRNNECDAVKWRSRRARQLIKKFKNQFQRWKRTTEEMHEPRNDES